MYYYPIYAGVDPADGMPMWYLPGEDKDVTTMDPSRVTKDFNEAELTQNTGKRRYAPFNGGFSLSGAWKGLSLQADFTYVLGKYMINNDAYFYMNPAANPNDNVHKAASDFWSPNNTDAQYPDWSKGGCFLPAPEEPSNCVLASRALARMDQQCGQGLQNHLYRAQPFHADQLQRY